MGKQDDLIIKKLTNIEKKLGEQNQQPLTFNEACEYLDMSRSYLYKLTSQGLISHYKPNGKKIFFSKTELDKWLFRNPVKTTSEIEQEASDYVVNGRKGGEK